VTKWAEKWEIALAGEHQQRNAALALAVARLLQPLVPAPESALREGFEKHALGWPFANGCSRRMVASVLLDGAHNPAGAQALAVALQTRFAVRALTLILGTMADKDYAAICRCWPRWPQKFCFAPSPATAEPTRGCWPIVAARPTPLPRWPYARTSPRRWRKPRGTSSWWSPALFILWAKRCRSLAWPRPIGARSQRLRRHAGFLRHSRRDVRRRRHAHRGRGRRSGAFMPKSRRGTAWRWRRRLWTVNSRWLGRQEKNFRYACPTGRSWCGKPSSAERRAAQPSLFDDLYSHFATAAPWRMFDDVSHVCANSSAAPQAGHHPNWDDRLRLCCANCNWTIILTALLFPARAGRKARGGNFPGRRRSTRHTTRGHPAHWRQRVGDVAGARAAGLRALLLTRGQTPASLSSLRFLPAC